MESKKLPVLWAYPEHVTKYPDKPYTSVTLDFRKTRGIVQEPYIPVARVRERLALFAQAHGAVLGV